MTYKVESMVLQRTVAPRTEIEEGITLARRKGISAIDLLVNEKQYSEESLAEGFAEWLKLPRVRLASLTLDPEAAKAVGEKMALKHQCLPLKIEGTTLVMAMANPADYDAIQDVQFVSGFTVRPVVATRSEIMDGIQEVYGTEDRMQDFLSKVADTQDFTIISPVSDKVDLDNTESQSAAESAPVIKMCNLILQEAIRSQASDVHLEPALNCLQVRMRVDGVLREYIDAPKWLQHPLVSRLKILASLDIAERRLPQDGRMKVKFQNRDIDLRVSTLPTLFGEKVVMRILGTTTIPLLEQMGMTEWQFATLTECLNQPQGLILLTGPTGSGKTTTLYSMISRRRSPEVNIVTVEDPIEYQLPGINQVQINTRTGLTFASCLRSILRQDPDVILVGEIRDKETAEIAFQAAVTGHLVLSTLHTNSSFAAITRLLELDVDPFLITSSLNLIVAQRLARRVCSQCKEAYKPPQELLKRFQLDDPSLVFYRGSGCPECARTGYSGRTGIYEMLRMTGTVKELIRQKSTESALRRAATAGGTRTLLEDGAKKVREGVTNPEELLRVIEIEAEETFPCPKCGATVHGDFRSCPFCMCTLRETCSSCGQELKPEWKICPYCASSVRATAEHSESGAVSPIADPKHMMQAANNSPAEARKPAALPAVNGPAELQKPAALPAVNGPAELQKPAALPAVNGGPAQVRKPAALPAVNSGPTEARKPTALPAVNSPAEVRKSAPSPAVNGPAELRKPAALPAVKCPKIVVADDDAAIVKVIQKALEQLPMPVEIFPAADGVKALETIERHHADLVILDVQMPRMDGFAVCDHLRKDIKTAFLPILILTASTDQNLQTKGYLVGTDDYMSKPFAVPDFVARVTRLLRRTYGL